MVDPTEGFRAVFDDCKKLALDIQMFEFLVLALGCFLQFGDDMAIEFATNCLRVMCSKLFAASEPRLAAQVIYSRRGSLRCRAFRLEMEILWRRRRRSRCRSGLRLSWREGQSSQIHH